MERSILRYVNIGLIIGILIGCLIGLSSASVRTSIVRLFHQEEVVQEESGSEYQAKTLEAKEATQNADYEKILAVGLHYDYVYSDLTSLLNQYLTERGLSTEGVSVYHQDIMSQEVTRHQTNEMIPIGYVDGYLLVMMALEELAAGTLTTERIAQESVAWFGYETTIEELQEEILVRDNTSAALFLSQLLSDKPFERYGQATEASLPTMDLTADLTSVEYLGQVMTYFWQHQANFGIMIDLMTQESSNSSFFYLMEAKNLMIYYYNGEDQTVNIMSIVYEDKPYLLALSTNGLTQEQLNEITFIINEWHRVHYN